MFTNFFIPDPWIEKLMQGLQSLVTVAGMAIKWLSMNSIRHVASDYAFVLAVFVNLICVFFQLLWCV